MPENTPLSPSNEIVSLKEQLEQQQIQCRQIVAQLVLVREQLITETNARIESQVHSTQIVSLTTLTKCFVCFSSFRLATNNYYNRIENF